MYKIKVFFIGLGVSLLLLGCESSEQGESSDMPYIVATTGMIADAARQIVGDSARVDGLMGPGVDPHLYKATRSDLSKLRDADLILYNGLLLEGKMSEVLEKLSQQKPVIAVADVINQQRLIDTGNDTHDPHIWFDLSMWKEAVEILGKRIAEQYPDRADFFLENAKRYTEELEALHQWTKKQIQSIPESQRVLITAHDAFGYFGQAYDIEVRGLQGISTISELGLRDVSALVNYIAERGIKAVFVESSVPSRSLEAVVAGVQQRGHDVEIGGTLYSDALGAEGTEAGTFVGTVRSNVNTIVSSLK